MYQDSGISQPIKTKGAQFSLLISHGVVHVGVHRLLTIFSDCVTLFLPCGINFHGIPCASVVKPFWAQMSDTNYTNDGVICFEDHSRWYLIIALLLFR